MLKQTLSVFLSLILCGSSYAGVMNERFQKLSNSAAGDPQAKIASLLKPYGAISDFKVVEEVSTSEECTQKSTIRAKVICEKKSNVVRKTYFAEGNGLLCKFDEGLNSVNCLISK